MNYSRKFGLFLYGLALGGLIWLGTFATTKVNLSTDVIGLGAVANGMTGAATTSANYVLSGPDSGAAAAYSFKIPAVATSGVVYNPNTYRWAIILPNGTNTADFQGIGSTAAGCGTGFTADSTNPTRCQLTTPAGGDNIANPISWGSGNAGRSGIIQFFYRTHQTADTRIHVGVFTSSGSGINCGSIQFTDSPDCSVAEFHYCNDVGASCTTDLTNWECYVKTTSGGAISRTTSGIAVDTNWHRMEIRDVGASFDFYVDGIQACSMNTNLPVSTAYLTPVMSIKAPTAGVVDVFSWGWIFNAYLW